MSCLTECQLLIDPPAPGPWNMAVDEMLLDWSAQQGACCWRFYRWDRPTLSLGYFQSYEDCLELVSNQACPVVRRLTGGGAIVHAAELTYSLVVPGNHPLAVERDLLYRCVHAALIESLAELGIAAALYEGSARRDQARQPLLCFQRRAPGDVLIGRIKIAGSAQRRRRCAVLQHGSLLLRRWPAASELPGFEDLWGGPVPEEDLTEAWLSRVSDRLAVRWCPASLSQRQRERADALVQSRYGSAHWTEKRRARPGPNRDGWPGLSTDRSK